MAYLGLREPNWADLGLAGLTWAYLGLPGLSWAYLGLPGPFWAYLGLPGSRESSLTGSLSSRFLAPHIAYWFVVLRGDDYQCAWSKAMLTSAMFLWHSHL